MIGWQAEVVARRLRRAALWRGLAMAQPAGLVASPSLCKRWAREWIVLAREARLRGVQRHGA